MKKNLILLTLLLCSSINIYSLFSRKEQPRPIQQRPEQPMMNPQYAPTTNANKLEDLKRRLSVIEGRMSALNQSMSNPKLSKNLRDKYTQERDNLSREANQIKEQMLRITVR